MRGGGPLRVTVLLPLMRRSSGWPCQVLAHHVTRVLCQDPRREVTWPTPRKVKSQSLSTADLQVGISAVKKSECSPSAGANVLMGSSHRELYLFF